MRNIPIIILTLLAPVHLISQTDVILNQPLNEDTQVIATNSITLAAGFSSNGYNFAGEVDATQSLFVVHNITPTSTQNYIQVISPRVPLDLIPPQSNFEATESVEYFDGLGRSEQVVSVGAGPTGQDIVQPIEYDAFGREVINYLPYTLETSAESSSIKPGAFRSDAINEQTAFFSITNAGADYATSNTPWSETDFDNSPLNRVMEQGAPGNAWQIERSGSLSTRNGHTVKYEYTINADNEVRKWNLSGNTFTSNGCYSAGELYVHVAKDENWQISDGDLHTTREYKDKIGNVVLKRTFVENSTTGQVDEVNTYYVYNSLNLLVGVIPPQASALTPAGSNTTFFELNATDTEHLCYRYTYDERRRMVEKKLPGASVVYMFYDARDRLIATQDGNQRNNYTNGRLSFTSFDALNRPVMTGEVTGIKTTYGNTYFSCKSYGEIQSILDSYNKLNEVRTLFGHLGYSTDAFPGATTSDFTPEYVVHTVTYYDHYNGFSSGYGKTGYSRSGITGLDNISSADFKSFLTDNTKGLVTGSRVRNLETGDYYFTSIYYDDKGRVIQTLSDNQMGGKDRVSTCYNFVGEPQATVTEHNNGSATYIIGDRFEYDHTGRILEHWQQASGNNEILLVTNKYNELGELVEKYNHGTGTAGSIEFLQKTDYKYNIRGWLTDINDPTNLDATDYFAMSLKYEDLGSLEQMNGLGAKGQYNGNISGIEWTDTYCQDLKGYAFGYDSQNRLKSAQYGVFGSVWEYPGIFDVKDITYDVNGNIKKLKRYNRNFQAMDILEYTYMNDNKSNSLLKVNDTGLDDEGFKDSPINGNDYTYDSNGNMLTDQNKGITTDISYNFLNLPGSVAVNGNTSTYTYDAAGVKLSHNNGTKITKYCGNFVYINGSLKYILTGEGRINVEGSIYSYEYFLKDHLGNTRVVFNENGDITQTSDYYPFGLQHESNYGAEILSNADQKYLYNGKELQDDTDWYDYGARMYDASLGRWMCIDPRAEDFDDLSPYHFAGNNPIIYLDPDGEGFWDVIKGIGRSIGNFVVNAVKAANPMPIKPEQVISGYIFIEEVATYGFNETVENRVEETVEAVKQSVDDFKNDETGEYRAEVITDGVLTVAAAVALKKVATPASIGKNTVGAARNGFTKSKRISPRTLRNRWEKANKKEWPKEPGNSSRNQSVSHKKALEDGGTNDVSNIEPKPWGEHHKMHKDNGDFRRWALKRKKNDG